MRVSTVLANGRFTIVVGPVAAQLLRKRMLIPVHNYPLSIHLL